MHVAVGKWLQGLAWLSLVVLIMLGVQAWQLRDSARGPAPAIEAVSLSGERISLQALKGQVVLVHFWATWCGICRAEQGAVDAIAADHPVISIAISSGEADEVRAYVQEHGLKAPVVVDPDGSLARLFGVRGVPTSFIVDGEGIIRHATIGYTTGLGLRTRLWLAGRSS